MWLRGVHELHIDDTENTFIAQAGAWIYLMRGTGLD